MIDSILIGYHETESKNAELSLALENPDELPPPIRSMLRTQLRIEGQFRPYLEALSYHRRVNDETGPLYTVAELPSLGTLYLANYLRKRGYSAEVVNCFTYQQDELRALLALEPRCVAITTTFYMAPAPVLDIVRFIRRNNDAVKIIVGGPLIDNFCRALDNNQLNRTLDRIGADFYIWESQGEQTLSRLVEAIAMNRSADAVPNVFCKSGATWSMSTRQQENNDLNECAVDWRLFSSAELGSTISTRTARSCAFKCAFCDYPARAGALALADIATVEKELEEIANLGVKRVAFIDDTFNVPVRRFLELCRMMVRRNFGLEWYSYFRCGNARDPEIYDLMRDAGCRGVLLGIESADDQVLLNMDKRATTKDYRFGIEQLKKRGMFLHASFVVGFPGETSESVKHTIDFLNETGPNTFAVNHWYYQGSTPIQKRAPLFQLRGKGHTWSHQTMDSKRALDAADEIFSSVTGAAWMPVNGLDFWGVPYLIGKGMSSQQVVQLLRLAKPLTAACGGGAHDAPSETPSVDTDVGPPQREFRDFCQGLTLEPARYEKEWSESR